MDNIIVKSLSVLISISMLAGSETNLVEMKLSPRYQAPDLNAYTYTFDETDLANLRTSVISSVKDANHFADVRDWEK